MSKFDDNAGNIYDIYIIPAPMPGGLGEMMISDQNGNQYSLNKVLEKDRKYMIFPKNSVSRDIFEINSLVMVA